MMVAVPVHAPKRDLEARVHALTQDLKSLGLKTSPPIPTPTPPSPLPSPSLAPQELSARRLLEMEERQARLDAALRGALSDDAEVEALRERRQQLETQQVRLERELEAQRSRVLQEGEKMSVPVCGNCARQRNRELHLLQQNERAEAKMRSTESELRSTNIELQRTRNQVVRAETELRSTQTELRSTNTKLQRTRNQVERAETELRSTQTELRSIKNQVLLATLELEKAEEEKRSLKELHCQQQRALASQVGVGECGRCRLLEERQRQLLQQQEGAEAEIRCAEETMLRLTTLLSVLQREHAQCGQGTAHPHVTTSPSKWSISSLLCCC